MRYGLIVFFVFFSKVCFADESLLALLTERSQTIDVLTGSFEQVKNISALPVPLHSQGVFSFNRNKDVMLWQTLAPINNTIRLSNDGIFVNEKALPADQQQGAAYISKIFMTVISGDLSGITPFFNVIATGTIDTWELSLTPQSGNIANYIQTIILRGSENTDEVEIAEANGDRTHIRLITNIIEHKSKSAP